jgi:hypothetical protein
MTAQALIEEIAVELGVKPETLWSWRSRGKVPYYLRQEIGRKAREEHRVYLTESNFNNLKTFTMLNDNLP